MTLALDDRLTEFDGHRFPISAHRGLIGSLFIIDAICWFDARQKQLQSATGTTPSGNRRQWGRIKSIWLWHRALLCRDRRERNLSLSHRRLQAEPRSVMVASEVRTIASVNPRRSQTPFSPR